MNDPGPDLRLVLWDIDHTLVETRGVGSELYQAAFEEVTGRRMEHKADVTGKTEQAILAETLRLHGLEPSHAYQKGYAQALAEQYRRNADLLRQRGRALPGAAEAIGSLAQQRPRHNARPAHRVPLLVHHQPPHGITRRRDAPWQPRPQVP